MYGQNPGGRAAPKAPPPVPKPRLRVTNPRAVPLPLKPPKPPKQKDQSFTHGGIGKPTHKLVTDKYGRVVTKTTAYPGAHPPPPPKPKPKPTPTRTHQKPPPRPNPTAVSDTNLPPLPNVNSILGGGGGGGGGGGLSGAMTPQSIQQLVDQEVNASINPERDMLLQQSRDQASTLSAAGLAAAQLLRPIGANVNQIYQDAAQNQAGFAQGFTGQIRDAATAEAQKEQQYLQTVQHADPAGAAQVAGVNPGSAHDVQYALGGYNPSAALSSSGAAFAAAASLLPGRAIGQSAADVARVNADARQKLADLYAKVPGLRLQIQSQLQDLSVKQRAEALNELIARSRLGLQAAGVQQGNARITLENRRVNQQTKQQDRQFKIQAQRLGIASAAEATKELALQRKLDQQDRWLGMSQATYTHLYEQAGSAAKNMHDGVPATSTQAAKQPVNFKSALSILRGEGVPIQMAIPILYTFYGPRERPRVNMNALLRRLGVGKPAYGGGVQGSLNP